MVSNVKQVSNVANQSDKNAWNRKFDNMQKLIDQVNTLADQIMDLEEQKMPLIDEINQLRTIMVQECIHPKDMIIEYDDHIHCKFCDKKFTVN